MTDLVNVWLNYTAQMMAWPAARVVDDLMTVGMSDLLDNRSTNWLIEYLF
jgi:hypothetical protein